jgi:uncharacterized membrane protein
VSWDVRNGWPTRSSGGVDGWSLGPFVDERGRSTSESVVLKYGRTVGSVMSLDIGDAFGDGLARLTGGTAAVLVVAFVVVAVASTVLTQTLQVEGLEALLEVLRGTSPAELDVSQAEYDRQVETIETQLATTRENSPLAVELPVSVVVAGLLAVAVLAEAVSIVAVRAFATDDPDEVRLEGTTDGLGMATVNGFVGGIVVWVLVIVGSVMLLLPGLFAAVAFYFFRQEVALEDENVIDAMVASWHLTKGDRMNVFALGALVVVVTQLATVASLLVGTVSALAASIVGTMLAGVLATVGAAVVTRAYVQLTEDAAVEAEPADPYDAALGPDDIPE